MQKLHITFFLHFSFLENIGDVMGNDRLILAEKLCL